MAIDFNALALAPCVGAFGMPVIYQPAAGPPVTLSGIFNEFAVEEQIDSATDLLVTKQRPIVTLNQADLPANVTPVQNDCVVIAGKAYAISEVLADGMGALTCKLRLPAS